MRCRRTRWYRLGHFPAGKARHERIHPRWRCRVPHLLYVRARSGRTLGRVPVARPCAQGPERERLLVAPPRQVLNREKDFPGCRTAAAEAVLESYSKQKEF